MADDNKKFSQYITARDLKNIRKMLRDYPQLNLEHRDILYGLQTPLMRVCHCNFPASDTLEAMNTMLLRHYDVNIQDGDGRCLLSHACVSQHAGIIELLSDVKSCYCNPNIPDNEGNTALIYAVRTRNPVLVDTFLKCFLDKSLNVHHRNSKGLTALEEAEMKSDREICHLLKRASKSHLPSHNKQVPNVQSLKLKRSPTPDFNHTKEDRRPSRVPSEEISPLVKSNDQHPLDSTLLKTRKKKRQERKETKQNDDHDDNAVENDEVSASKCVQSQSGGMKRQGLTPRERKNSFSLPDLSANNGSLVSSSPSSSSGESDIVSPTIETSPSTYVDCSNADGKGIENIATARVKQSNRNTSLSLPELRIDHVVPNGVFVEKKSGGVYITSVTPRRAQPTPRKQITQDLIHSAHVEQAGASSERYEVSWKQKSTNGLTLPQIDTTPRMGYPSPRSHSKNRVPYH